MTTISITGDYVSLRARAINPLTGQPLSGLNIGFWQDGYGYGTLVNDRYYNTDGNGVATTDWMYPSVGGAHTIIAKVKDDQPVANVTLAIQPVTLSVGVETRLWLWVERGLTNTEHTVYARLVRANDTMAVQNQVLKLDVGGTIYTLTTNGTGCVKQSLNLVALGGQTTTYQVRAVFEGAGFKTRNLTIPDPYGRNYAVCTTMQWDFKSSQNSVTLTVEAPKTDVTTSEPASPEDNVTVTQTPETTTVTVPPPKTPEQLQAEAEQSGGLTIWHEFTWWYPWYRLHFVLNTTLPPYGTLYIDYGWSILPSGTSFQANNAVLGLILNDVAEEFVEEYLISTVIAVIAKRIAAGLLGKTVGGILAAIGIYTLFSLLEMGVKYATTGNNLKTWLMAFLSSALACFLDLMVDVLDTLQFLTAIGRRVVGAISHTLNSMWARGLTFFDITSVIFTFIDFALMIGYLIMYKVAVG